MTPWALPTVTKPIRAVVGIPGSKSESNRALVLAGLATGPSTLSGLLRARDTELMMDGLRAFGVLIEDGGDGKFRVTPQRGRLQVPDHPIDCGLAGTVARFLPPVAALAAGRTRFVGDPAMSTRPMEPLLDGLRQLGCTVDGNAIPFEIIPPRRIWGQRAAIDASASSQFISGLLLSAARFPRGLELASLSPRMPSAPHVAMTVAMLRDHGVRVDADSPGQWRVWPGPIEARDEQVQPDLSTAAAFVAAAALAGGEVTIPGWPEITAQPGDRIRSILTEMGADCQWTEAGLTVRGTGELHGIDLDLHAASELTPVVTALLAQAAGPSRIRGVGHIRGHETDRLAALVTELRRVGVEAQETTDGLMLTGSPTGLRVPTDPLRSYADHRMVQFAALLGLRTPGLTIDDPSGVAKTMPDFVERWQDLVGAGT